VSLLAGASVLGAEPFTPERAAAALGATALTSVLEEMGLERPEAWLLFPAPGGIVFPLVAFAAIVLSRRFVRSA